MWILKPRVIHQSVLGGQPAGSGQLSSPLKLRPGAGFPPPAAHLCPEKPSASLRTNVMGTWGACCTLTFNPCEDPWVAGDRLNRLPNPGTLGSPRQRAQDPHSESLYPRRAHHGARTRASWAARLEFKFWIQVGGMTSGRLVTLLSEPLFPRGWFMDEETLPYNLKKQCMLYA